MKRYDAGARFVCAHLIQEVSGLARIVVIDDNDLMREMLQDMLGAAGYEVVAAPTGKEGVRLYREMSADLIITDIMMPGEDGLEVIRQLQGEFPDIKIIAISGGDMKGRLDYLSFAEEFGALRAFSKPFDPKELLATVKELVDQS